VTLSAAVLLAVLVGVGVGVGACTPPHTSTPQAPATAGVTIALYSLGDLATSYGVVDDRRWVELTDHDLVLDHIDPGASLASLVIEPLGAGAPLVIERCVREALPDPVRPPRSAPSAGKPVDEGTTNLRGNGIAAPRHVEVPLPAHLAPIVRCAVAGGPGRRLVRILYVSHSLGYRTQHDLVMATADRAQLATRFTIATPAWRERADVVVFDGVPGGTRAPTELARGTVTLDGSVAILTTATHDVGARLRWIYDGAISTPDADGADVSWNAGSVHAVWVWAELPNTTLAPGPIHVRVALPDQPERELDAAAGLRDKDRASGLLRIPLWADADLIGSRSRFSDGGDTGELAERLLLSVANTGEAPREVWVEEHVRPSRHRKIERAWPKRPMAAGDIVRAKVEVKPHAIERVGYTITYSF
jgi:hypothetical protein